MPPQQGVFPTRMTLTLFKGKQVGAVKGYDLLKKKSDALTVRLRSLLKEIKKVSDLDVQFLLQCHVSCSANLNFFSSENY